ncbi:hypothetical protein RZS08_62195, partial [Arthrospira platensis SPKY1]|nr:hypothetical protein [Arthrospira platensis SPKY1]
MLTMLFQEVAYSVNNSGVVAGWNIAGSGGTYVANAPWAPGQAETFWVEFNVPSDAHYQAALDIDDFWASVGAANPDPNTGNNYRVLFYESQAQADLTIEKTLFTP